MSPTSNWIFWSSMIYPGMKKILHVLVSTIRIICRIMETRWFDWPSVLLRLANFAGVLFCHGAAPPPIP